MDMDLIEQLSAARDFPREALRRATAAPDTIAEAVLAALSKAAEDPDAVDDREANLLFWGLHVLAAARDTRVYGPLLCLLRQDSEAVDRVLNSATAITTGRLVSSTFDGDAAPLHALILDKAVDGFARYDGLKALAFLTRQGRLPLDDARTLLVRFDTEKAAAEGDTAWVGWEEVIAYLGLTDLAPRVEAARRDGRLTDEFSDLAWFRKALRQASAEPPDFSEFGDDYGTLDDPVAALEWLDDDSDSLFPEDIGTLDRSDLSLDWPADPLSGRPAVNPFKDVGRNDPCPCGSGKKYKKCCLDAQGA